MTEATTTGKPASTSTSHSGIVFTTTPNIAPVVGGVVGGIVALALLAFLFYLYRADKRSQRKNDEDIKAIRARASKEKMSIDEDANSSQGPYHQHSNSSSRNDTSAQQDYRNYQNEIISTRENFPSQRFDNDQFAYHHNGISNHSNQYEERLASNGMSGAGNYRPPPPPGARNYPSANNYPYQYQPSLGTTESGETSYIAGSSNGTGTMSGQGPGPGSGSRRESVGAWYPVPEV